MPKYIVKINLEQEIKAKDEKTAIDNFWCDLEQESNQPLDAILSSYVEVERIK